MAPRPRKTGSKDLPPNLYRKTDSRNGVTYYSYRDPVSGKWYGLGSDKAQAVREAVKPLVFFKTMPYARIELAKLGPDAGIIGAAMLGK